MTLYAEVVFISNFFVDTFIYVLTLIILKCNVNLKRLFISATLGGIMSTVIPIMGSYYTILKVLGIIVLPLIFRKNTNVKTYLATVSVFITVTLLLGGMVYLLDVTIGENKSVYLYYGTFPIIYSIAGMSLIFLYVNLRKFAFYDKIKNKNIYEIEICVEGKNLRIEAYYDSGNRVYANNGEPVTIVTETIYNMFDAEEDEVIIRTINGVSVLKTKKASIVVFGNENKVYNAKIAEAPLLNSEYHVILHSDMLGG